MVLDYDLTDDGTLCVFSPLSNACSNLPAGAVPMCYPSQDTKYPTKDQICAYKVGETLVGAPGCCKDICPSPHCPSVKSRKIVQDARKITDTYPTAKGLADSGCVKTCAFDKSTFTNKPYCYSNDDSNPNQEQMCAYETGDGSLTIVDGCCDKICPSSNCPNEMFSPPEMIRNTELPTPFSKLIKLMLILFAILLVSGIIFSLMSS